jgi:hypothetical protein
VTVAPCLGSNAALEEQAPKLFDTSIQGRFDLRWPHGGWGPAEG